MDNKKTNRLNILFSVLLFGGLWGIVEATLGTILHLPMVKGPIFLSSTAVLLPIACFFMGACYKRTQTFRSVLYMGILAGGIKALSCWIFVMDFKPVAYMIFESLMMGVALLIIRPKKVLSYQGLATFVLASTLYLVSSSLLRLDLANLTQEIVMADFEKYVLKYNALAILYTFAFGAILFGFTKLAEKYNWNFDKIKTVIYHPAFASGVAAVAVVLTFVLR